VGLGRAGRFFCACGGVGPYTTCDTSGGGGPPAAEIGAKLKAGTNCGSCIPELKQLIAQTGSVNPERKLAVAN
jgi:assimilatory nitrate reductase catalytic subunit